MSPSGHERDPPGAYSQQKPRYYPTLGAVVIGRNEASHLVRCLKSLGGCATIVYVDSGSTDESVSIAANQGARLIELPLDTPFTAARARNAGFRELCSLNRDLKYVQFIDGDCEVINGWIPHAFDFLEANPEVAAVCGRRMERYPTASIYNAILSREWDTPIGQADACGGDAMMSANAFRSVGGFADTQIAHEEPELCGRLRRAGWKIWRIDQAMTLHDAAMYRIEQFYRRCRRAGFGITQCLFRSGVGIDPGGRVIIQRAVFWSIGLPIVIVLLTMFINTWAGLLLFIYPGQLVRLAIEDGRLIRGNVRQRLKASALSMLAKFAAAHGCIEFCIKHALGLQKKAIFYK